MLRKINIFVTENKAFAENLTLFFVIISGAFFRLYDIENYTFNVDGYYEVAIGSAGFLKTFYYNLFYFTDPPVGSLAMWLGRSFTTDEYWLRLIPIIPSIISIYAAFLAGKALLGKNGGLVFSIFASFLYLSVSLSYEMRSYCITLVFLYFSIYFLASFDARKRKSDALFFFVFMFLAVFSKIMVIVFYVSIAIFAFLEILYKNKFKLNKKCLNQLIKWSAPFLLVFLLAAIYFYFQRPWKSMPELMTDSPTAYGRSIDIFLEMYTKAALFVFNGPSGSFLFELIATALLYVGLTLLFFYKKRFFLFVVTFYLTVTIFNLFRIVPLAEGRYSFLYLPVAMLAAALCITHFTEILQKKFKLYKTFPAYTILLIAVIFSFNVINSSFHKTDASILPKDMWVRGFVKNLIRNDISEKDIVFVDAYNSFFFTYKLGLNNLKEHKNNISSFYYEGRPFYFRYNKRGTSYMYHDHFYNKASLKSFFYDLFEIIDSKNIRKIWYIDTNISWPMPIENEIGNNNKPGALKKYTSDFISHKSGFNVFSITPANLDRYFKSEPPVQQRSQPRRS